MDIIDGLGEKDFICQKAGKELADVGQEAMDKDGRVMDSLLEGMQASAAMQNMMARAKTEQWDARKMWIQFALGMLRDVAHEDMSLDVAFQPGSQG